MPSIWIIKSVGIIVGSLMIGFIFYYVTSPLVPKQKKKRLEEVLSLIINFVIFMWIGKIVLNLSTFVSDPLAILAYPSNAHAFYLATLFLTLNIVYKVWRHQFSIMSWFASFVPVFLAASFTFEFIQLINTGNEQLIRQMIFLMVLLIIYLVYQGKRSDEGLALSIMTAWALGQFVLSVIFYQTTLFGYAMKPWFNVMLILAMTLLLVYQRFTKHPNNN